MERFYLALFSGKTQRFRTDAKDGGGSRQVHPAFGLSRLVTIDGYFVMAAKRCHPFAGPAIVVSGAKIISVEQARDHIVAAYARKDAYRLHSFRRRTVSLPTPPARQAQFGMNATHPMHDKNDLSALFVEVGDHLANELAHDALLQAHVGCRITPDRFQIGSQRRELPRARRGCC
jgi:hypothetical protein